MRRDHIIATDRTRLESPKAAQPTARSQPFAWLLLVIFAATIGAQLLSLAFGRQNVAQDVLSILAPSLVFLSVVTLPLAALGLALGRGMNLGAPLIAALLQRQPGAFRKLRSDAGLAIALGLAAGAVLLLVRQFAHPYLPTELPAFGHRGVIGGLSVSLGAAVAEEVWFRLGAMTVLVWIGARLFGHKTARPVVAWPAIVITAFGFGLAHLPQLMSYGADSPFAIGGTILGNCAVGVLYGWCYWRRSLLAAIVAHFSVDGVLHVLPALIR